MIEVLPEIRYDEGRLYTSIYIRREGSSDGRGGGGGIAMRNVSAPVVFRLIPATERDPMD